MSRLVFGVGNSSGVKISNKGKRLKSYQAWKNMLQRCYQKTYQEKHHTYKDCFVNDEWLDYKTFKKWYDENSKNGFHLDKDLLFIGNKEYSKEKCRFVSGSLNKLFLDNKLIRGEYPIGVSYCKERDNYETQINKKGRRIFLGRFDSIEEASLKYLKEKKKYSTIEVNSYYKSGDITRDLYLSLIRRISLL